MLWWSFRPRCIARRGPAGGTECTCPPYVQVQLGRLLEGDGLGAGADVWRVPWYNKGVGGAGYPPPPRWSTISGPVSGGGWVMAQPPLIIDVPSLYFRLT
jgi:hypothetical protein